MHGGNRQRDEDDNDELDRAIALSFADTGQESVWAEASDAWACLTLDRAIAASLDEELELQPADGWDCALCTLTNASSTGRCACCSADRVNPYASKERAPTARPETRCGLPGCNRTRTYFDYCSEDHQRRACDRRMLAPQSEGEDRVFLGATGDFTCALLTQNHADWASVVRQFRAYWLKGQVPRVERVYAVSPKPQLTERFERHAAAVGNVRRRFHGTGSACNFAVDCQNAPCGSDACALCSILSNGFELRHAGSGPNARNAAAAAFGTGRLRYGPGLYFSSTSGKSNDYAANSERERSGRRWCTLFVAKVATGNAFCTCEAELSLTKPPEGHDSVVGEVVAKGGQLNYDELVVYSEAAALPEFLIVVSFDP